MHTPDTVFKDILGIYNEQFVKKFSNGEEKLCILMLLKRDSVYIEV